MSVDYISLMLFLAVSFLFAVIIGFLLKWTIGKYVPAVLNVSLWIWVIIIILIMLALEEMGVPVSDWYAGFFSWLSKQLHGGI